MVVKGKNVLLFTTPDRILSAAILSMEAYAATTGLRASDQQSRQDGHGTDAPNFGSPQTGS